MIRFQIKSIVIFEIICEFELNHGLTLKVEESTKLRCLFLDCINLFLSFKIKTAGMYDYDFIIIILQKIRQYE